MMLIRLQTAAIPGLTILLFLIGCGTNVKLDNARGSAHGDEEIVESSILWKAESDPVTWKPIELESVLSNSDRYVKEGNFYKVNDTIYVFGHEALYVGMLGVGLVPGPNAVLEGKPSTISQTISEKHQISFNEDGGTYVAELEEHVRLIVAPYPEINNATIVIGGYFGL
jgi:hypothetical protein